MSRSTSSQGSQGETYTHDPYCTGDTASVSGSGYGSGDKHDTVDEATVRVKHNMMCSIVSNLPAAAAGAHSGKILALHTVVRPDPTTRLGAWVRGNSITNIVPSSPAEEAGLKVGMRILEVSGVPLASSAVSSVTRSIWKDMGLLYLLVEIPQGTKSKRSLAKARARQRAKVSKATARRESMSQDEETDSAGSLGPSGCVITPVSQCGSES